MVPAEEKETATDLERGERGGEDERGDEDAGGESRGGWGVGLRTEERRKKG